MIRRFVTRSGRPAKAALAAVLMVLAIAAFSACGKADDSLYVYNYGEYIADGSYGIFDAVAGFEEYYEELTGRSLKVYYTTYASNEDLYAKISSGTAKYTPTIAYTNHR